MFYTGGTTGMPKGVMYSMQDFAGFFLQTYPSMIGQPKIPDPALLPANRASETRARGAAYVSMSGPPLMHGTGCWLGMMVPQMLGGTAVLLEGRSLDPVELWSAVARERINLRGRRRRRLRQAAARAASTRTPALGRSRASSLMVSSGDDVLDSR